MDRRPALPSGALRVAGGAYSRKRVSFAQRSVPRLRLARIGGGIWRRAASPK